jgi:hypothetical protein
MKSFVAAYMLSKCWLWALHFVTTDLPKRETEEAASKVCSPAESLHVGTRKEIVLLFFSAEAKAQRELIWRD